MKMAQPTFLQEEEWVLDLENRKRSENEIQ